MRPEICDALREMIAFIKMRTNDLISEEGRLVPLFVVLAPGRDPVMVEATFEADSDRNWHASQCRSVAADIGAECVVFVSTISEIKDGCEEAEERVHIIIQSALGHSFIEGLLLGDGCGGFYVEQWSDERRGGEIAPFTNLLKTNVPAERSRPQIR